MMRWTAAVIVLLSARELAACSISSGGLNGVLENRPVCSANGRFCAIARWHEGVPDFGSRVADERPFDPDAEPPPRRHTVTTALYESRTLLAEIPVDVDAAGDMLVSDSGQYLVATRDPGARCGDWPDAADPLITIFKSNGSRVAALTLGDVATPYDVMKVRLADVGFALRPESDTRELIVISFAVSNTETVERRVDLATGALLDEKRPIFPPPRITATPSPDTPKRELEPASAGDCVDADALNVESTRFLARVIDGPLSQSYPIVAMKARISGFVRVEALVSEKGQVLCTRHSRLPFGLDIAADAAVRTWTFEPMSINGKRARYRGDVLIHFELP